MKIGVDIECISKFSNIKQSDSQNILINFFTKNEILFSLNQKNISLYFAILFALKEAIFKAIGIKADKKFSISNIEILDIYGKLNVNFYGIMKRYIKENISISYSWDGENVIACAVMDNFI